MTARTAENSVPARRLALPLVVFALSLVVLMATDSMYGITYDEPIYQSKSIQALEWLRLFATSPGLATSEFGVNRYWQAKDRHPGFFKLLTASCGATLGRLVAYNATWRTGTNLLAALCVAGLCCWVSGLWGRAAGIVAAGSLLLMPRVFAHCHLAALDAPVMSLSFLAVVASWSACRRAGRSSWGWAALAGVLWGLGLGTKLNAFFVPFIVFPWVLVFARRGFWPLAACFALLGPLSFWVTWPWLWHDTLPRFLEYFRFHLQHYPVSVMYLGRNWDYAPWHYPLVMTLVTTPPAVLVLAVVGMSRLWGRKRLERGPMHIRKAALVLAGWALVVNILPNCLPETPKYGGVRLFLPVFPYLALFAAVGFQEILGRAVELLRPRVQVDDLRPKLAALAVFLALVGPLMAVARFTPYHLSYYNAFIGGLPGAVRAGMEPTYWGDTYRTAALWLAEHAGEGERVWVDPVGFESTVRLFEIMPLRPDLETTSGPDTLSEADWAVTQNKPIEFSPPARRLVESARPAYTDGIDGVPLIYVFRMTPEDQSPAEQIED
ncbi:MAG: glycosyltransferase family 39 protein [Armatimonadetes bacterium]|nr:glycosyltransferase family 39 protein [Armatimonadota bacterium]